MIENYIYEEIDTLTQRKINGYEKMINKIGRDYLDRYQYKVANFYSMLRQDRSCFQKIAPECFRYGIRRTHLLPNEHLSWMTFEQIKEILSIYKENNIFDMETLIKWKEVCAKDKNLSRILDRMIKRLFRIRKHQLYLKTNRFYQETNLIGTKDVISYLYPYLCIQDNSKKKQKLESIFGEQIFISDKLIDYHKMMTKINELYTGEPFSNIQQMMTLKECERAIFLEYYEEYGPNEEILKGIIYLFESSEKVNNLPCIKIPPAIYNLNDVRECIKDVGELIK